MSEFPHLSVQAECNAPHLYESDVVAGEESGQPRALLVRGVREPLQVQVQVRRHRIAHPGPQLEDRVVDDGLHGASGKGSAGRRCHRPRHANVELEFYLGVEHVIVGVPDLDKSEVFNHEVRVGPDVPLRGGRELFVLRTVPQIRSVVKPKMHEDMSALWGDG